MYLDDAPSAGYTSVSCSKHCSLCVGLLPAWVSSNSVAQAVEAVHNAKFSPKLDGISDQHCGACMLSNFAA